MRSIIGILAIAILHGDARAETAADIGTLPSQKVPAPVDNGDRNPFATRLSPGENDPNIVDAESEESKIRQVFANLSVDGHVSTAGGAGRVLVGDLILKEGADIPQVIENQTDVLRVTRITDKEVEIIWIDEEEADAPRKLVIPINLRPEVTYVLPGRAREGVSQFTTRSGQEQMSAEPRGGQDEEDADAEESAEEPAAPAEPKRISPFGLFRR